VANTGARRKLTLAIRWQNAAPKSGELRDRGAWIAICEGVSKIVTRPGNLFYTKLRSLKPMTLNHWVVGSITTRCMPHAEVLIEQ
jgi:hypothetical protein